MSTKTKRAGNTRKGRQNKKQKSDEIDVDEIFEKMDLNHDGRISVIELTKAAQLLGHNPTRKEAEQMIQDCNPSQKGYVTKTEFKRLFEDRQADIDSQIEDLANAFRVFDKDDSGTITADEIRAVLHTCGDNVSEEEINDMLKMVDKDGDGNIDIEEFAAVMCDMG